MPLTDFIAEHAASRERNLLRQELRESRQRARLGGFYYPPAAALAFIVAGDGERWLQGAAVVLAFLVLALLRTQVRDIAGDDMTAMRWRLALLWGLVLTTTLCWGAFSAWCYLVLPEPAPLVSLLFSGAFGMALAHTFCMRPWPAALGILFVMVPSLVTLWQGVAPGVGVTWAIYTLYMLMVMRRSYREYRTRLELEEDLRHQRDLFERQSLVDGLTGLANRREFTLLLDDAVERGRAGAQVSLLIFDVDHFKRINDSLGHLAGDACLVILAERLCRHFKATGELCARLGGEEFGVILAGDEAQAYLRAEGLRTDLAEQPLEFEGIDPADPVTVSVGCGAFDPVRHGDGASLYREVDAALYRAKMAGRNRTERVSRASDAVAA